MPERRPTAIFLAMHKGGSSFLANDFADAISACFDDLEAVNVGNQIDGGTHTYEDLAVPPTGAIYVRVYPKEYDQLVERVVARRGRLRNTKLVVLRRDPRDAAVSRYFSMAYSHSPPKDWAEGFLRRRDELVKQGPDAGILRVSRQTILEFNHLARIIATRPDALVTTYEHMITDLRGWMQTIGDFLDWTVAEQELLFEATKESFEFPVVGNRDKHIRRITPGNWRRYDRQEFREVFEELAGENLARAGYLWPKD